MKDSQGMVYLIRLLLLIGTKIFNIHLFSPFFFSKRSKTVGKNGYTKLMDLCSQGNYADVKSTFDDFLQDLNVQDKSGYTALMYAVSSGNYDLVKFLLDNGANKNLNTINGNDAVFFAKKYKHDEILKLITKESSVEEVLKRTDEMFAKLKKQGYDIDNSPPLTDQQRDEFETVLHNAKRTGKFDWDIKK